MSVRTDQLQPYFPTVVPRMGVSVRFFLMELAGGLGDLGTFVPIAVGMVQIVGLDAATLLIFAGLLNIVSGLAFGVPIAVQPMKAICALAIAGALTSMDVGIAGLFVGLCMLLMGVTGMIGRLDKVIPKAVLRGLQMAVAFHLLLSGFRLAVWDQAAWALRPFLGVEGLLVMLGAVTLVWVGRRRLSVVALGLIVLGLFGALVSRPELAQSCEVALWRPRWILSESAALKGIWQGGLPQIPLTLLNSVLAVSVMAGQLFPKSKRKTSPARIAISVGLMNLIACPFGAMPVCHGSGGLAGQYRFGARSSLSMVLLGAAKLCLGLFFGAVALAWMQAFPAVILGVFLLIAGVGLAQVSRFWETRRGTVTACVMLAVHLATGQLLAGFFAGWLVYAFLNREKGSSHKESING